MKNFLPNQKAWMRKGAGEVPATKEEITLSRGFVCNICGKSAEDENGNIRVIAPDCTDPECAQAGEPGDDTFSRESHWHSTYATRLCKSCYNVADICMCGFVTTDKEVAGGHSVGADHSVHYWWTGVRE